MKAKIGSLFIFICCSLHFGYGQGNSEKNVIRKREEDRTVPALHIISIRLNNNQITKLGTAGVLDTLTLNSNEGRLTIEFADSSQLSYGSLTYASLLNGMDTGWQQLGAKNSVTYPSLRPGEYTFKVKAANGEGVWGTETSLPISVTSAYNGSGISSVLFLGTLGMIVLFLAILVIIFYFRRSQYRLMRRNLKMEIEKEKLQHQQTETEFQKKLADLKLSSLRSQISPHFVFNCLNSIKLYAAQNDVEAVSNYLTKFSLLIRKVLDISDRETIALSEELEVLQLYLELEAMRFKDKLQYNISIQNIDADYIEIPPLLLQPYVENAIWHGLMNKEGGGHIDIKASVEDSFLVLLIKDDGIGRAKAAELNGKSATRHKSFGMKITSDRLALINHLHKSATSVAIEDLMDDTGIAAGTQVTIKIEI
ncbi:MAG TPA: histidine kinase [Chitinophagaceae bacterium]|nr:histidine kinase [Chitinophagaceae bacterium]